MQLNTSNSLRGKIKDIAYYLPEKIVTNEDLEKENPTWKIGRTEEKTGVFERHIANPNESALDLAFEACKKLFAENPDAKDQIDAIIFCTQTGDHIMPPNACILHKLLGLHEKVFAFDYNLACSGYVYGLGISQGLIVAGLAKNILLITADTYSKLIHDKDRSIRVLFGDGAAVSWICQSHSAQGILDIQCFTDGKHYDWFIVPAGGCRLPKSKDTANATEDESGNWRTLENIHMDGLGILRFVNSKIPGHIEKFLESNDLTLDQIDQVIFHQASKLALDSLTRLLKIGPEKLYRNIDKVGNTVSASIPIALKDALIGGRVAPGDKILLSGFGVGFSWGSAIVEI
jgi:3-oxoacyl-[acyl-carrier-protein] synthase III